MNRFAFPLLIFVFAACSTNTTPTPASFFDLTPAPANLGLDSNSEQIRRALWESASRWTTLQMDGFISWYLPDGATQSFREQVWLDSLKSRFKAEVNETANTQRTLKLIDGNNVYDADLVLGQYQTFPFPDFARVGQYIPPIVEGESHPNPIWGQLGTPLSLLAFASDFSQNDGTFKAVAIESIAGREALVTEWTYIANSAPSLNLWVDTKTGVILKMQEFSKDGAGRLEGERVVEHVTFDLAFDDSVFKLPDGLSSVVSQNAGAGSMPVVTESVSGSNEEAGELYFFLQPHQAGQSIQLAKVSGVCVFDSINCPPLQIVNVPFPFNFTIHALSWSPDGNYAAFAYSDRPNGTPTKLWLFDPSAGTWTPLAEFPYIDPPFWSPDGSWIAFRTQDGLGGEDVYVARRDGSELKSVSANLPAGGRPYIMDGWYTENIMMRPALPGSNGSVYLVRASDGFARPMFETLLTKAEFIASPDASLLAYDEYDYNSQNHNVKVMVPDGAKAVTLASFSGGSIYPMVWSPDGSLIAFNFYGSPSGNSPGSAEVYVVSRDGKIFSLAYKGVTVGRLLFSPNGRYLLVEETTSISGGHLFVIDLVTMTQSMLQAPGLSIDYDWYAPSWRP